MVGKDMGHIVKVLNGLPSVLVAFMLMLVVICGFMVSLELGKGIF